MQAELAPEPSGGLPNSLEKAANKIENFKLTNHSDPKPKMNIALDGSTYTKTIDLTPQDFYKLSSFDDLGSDCSQSYPQTSTTLNGLVSHPLNESIEPTLNPTVLSKKYTSFSTSPSRGKLRSASKSTFFSRLARRLTIRRSNSKPPTAVIPNSFSNDANSSKPPQVPTSRKIRRWFSKYLIPPYKNSSSKPSPDAFNARAATFDITIDKRFSHPTEDFGSAPTHRRVLLPPNLSESSLCNSQAGTLSLGDDPFEINGSSCHQGALSYEKERLISSCTSGSIPTKADNHAAQLSSAFSSPSVTAIGPPPRYLNVSLAAFGYTCCNRKWVSAQTLEHGKTPVGGAREPNPISEGTTTTTTSAFLGATLTPQRRKSNSPAPVSRNRPGQLPLHLDFHDSCNRPDASSTPRVSGLASPISQNGDNTTCINNNNNSSGVTIRVKHNFSNGNSQLACGTEGADQTQSDLNRSNHSHHEHWNRSSLIMLAVAQASPRTHNAPSTSNGTAATPSQPQSAANGGSHTSFNESVGNAAVPSSPSKTFPGRRLTFNDEGAASMESQLPKVDEIPSVNSDASHEEVATNGGVEEITTALRTSTISIENGNVEDIKTLAAKVVAQKDAAEEVMVRDGHFFLRLADETELELRSRVEEIERDLTENELSDEVSGHLRTTVGKVNLLLSQKFVQFRGLCADCIAVSEKTTSGEEVEFVTLPSDLEGFWAMVMLQVDDLHSMIASCDRLRQNGWKTDPDTSNVTNGNGTNHSTPASAKRRQPKPVNSTPAKDSKAAALARNQARERLRAAKLQYMRSRKEELAANATNGSISSGEHGGASVVNESGENSTFLVL